MLFNFDKCDKTKKCNNEKYEDMLLGPTVAPFFEADHERRNSEREQPSSHEKIGSHRRHTNNPWRP